MVPATVDRGGGNLLAGFTLSWAEEQVAVSSKAREDPEPRATDAKTHATTHVKTRPHRARRRLRAELLNALEANLPHVYDFQRERCDRVVLGVLARISRN